MRAGTRGCSCNVSYLSVTMLASCCLNLDLFRTEWAEFHIDQRGGVAVDDLLYVGHADVQVALRRGDPAVAEQEAYLLDVEAVA